jgi:hypothetical protein
VGTEEPHGRAAHSDTQYLWHHVHSLDHQLSELRSQLHFLHWREKRHRQTIESTNRRVIWFTLLRAGVLATAGLAQVVGVRYMFSR